MQVRFAVPRLDKSPKRHSRVSLLLAPDLPPSAHFVRKSTEADDARAAEDTVDIAAEMSISGVRYTNNRNNRDVSTTEQCAASSRRQAGTRRTSTAMLMSNLDVLRGRERARAVLVADKAGFEPHPPSQSDIIASLPETSTTPLEIAPAATAAAIIPPETSHYRRSSLTAAKAPCGELQLALRRWGLELDTERLELQGVPLGPDDLRALSQMLSQNQPYNFLDISATEVTLPIAKVLSQAMAANTAVRTLLLQRCEIIDAAAGLLADMLAVNQGLETVSLHGCRGLTRRGMERLLRAVDRNQQIKTVNGFSIEDLRRSDAQVLDLSGIPLFYCDALLVAHHLRTRGDGLVRADFSGAAMSSDAFRVVARALLATTTTLEVLQVARNRLDARVVGDFCRLAAANRNLATVDAADNFLGCSAFEPHGQAFLNMLATNAVLTTFVLNGNPADEAFLRQIEESLTVNRALQGDELTLGQFLAGRLATAAPQPLVPPPGDMKILVNADVAFLQHEGLPSTEMSLGLGRDGGYRLQCTAMT